MRLKPQSRNAHAQRKAEENRDAAETRKRTRVQMALLIGRRNPSARICEIADVPGKYEGRKQSRKKQPQENYGQLRHLENTTEG